MIAYAIEAAKASGAFDHIVVTTDDAEIAQIAGAAGAETPFVRPPELADDFTPTVPVIAHAVRACLDLNWQIDTACCIYPGVPFIEPGDLVAGVRLLDTAVAAYVFAVAPFPSAIQRALRRREDGTVAPFNPEYASTRTQDLEPGYFDAGQFYWGTKQAWLDGLNIHANGAAIVLPEWRAVDIDTPADWERAEAMYRALCG